MKKICSAVFAFIFVLLTAVPVFAAESAKFKLNIVSETEDKLVVSVDYAGGATFACFDFEIDYNKSKLTAVKGVKGDGMNNFSSYVSDNNGAAISSINASANPIKATFATTVDFSAVKGNDLFVITFEKRGKDKINSSDVTLYFTNCQTSQFKDVPIELSSALPEAPATDKKPSKTDPSKNEQKNEQNETPKTQNSSSDSVESNPTGSNSVSEQTDDSEVNSHALQEQTPTDSEHVISEKSSTKKIIAVGAAAVCMVIVIAAVVIYIVKKSKDNTEE